MQRILTIFITLILLSPVVVKAQSAATQQPAQQTIVEKIEEGSNGEVIIDIPAEMLKEILEEPAQRPAPTGSGRQQGTGTRHERVTNKGFRVQIFSDGRNQSTLRSRANARANAVAARFPKYRGQIYTFSQAPNWYSRVGNFRTREEANSALAELRRAFPAFASEMRVVQSAIVPTK
ncbi:MAG: hypothetical protein HDS66_06815 [Bacteroidales bacterium]|nr:hypothetical protein [Bacteroidales bacterium]